MGDALRRIFAPVIALIVGILKALTRVTSFVGKEVIEVIRRPGVLFSLILGPFLIMSLFGAGYSGQYQPLKTVVVVPPEADLPRDVGYYQSLADRSVQILEVTGEVSEARARLQRQQIDLVVIAPADAQASFLRGEQSIITVEYNQVDPVRDNYAQVIAQRQVQELNRSLVERAAAEGQRYAIQSGARGELTEMPPQVVASPTWADTENVAPSRPSMVQYYAPAVLALVLQHMGVTLTALSIVRERLSGAMDLFRVAPVTTAEILVGKYLAYGFLNAAIAALITFLMVQFLEVPMLGNPGAVATVVALLTFASMGLGFLISTLADSERQAVQLSMLVLLASVFLSGFVLPLEEFLVPVRWAGYALPVTYGIQLMQDTMLRGSTNALWQFYALIGFGAALFFITSLTLHRNLSRG